MLWAFVIKTLASSMRDVPSVHVNSDSTWGPGQTLRDLGDQSHHYSDAGSECQYHSDEQQESRLTRRLSARKRACQHRISQSKEDAITHPTAIQHALSCRLACPNKKNQNTRKSSRIRDIYVQTDSLAFDLACTPGHIRQCGPPWTELDDLLGRQHERSASILPRVL